MRSLRLLCLVLLFSCVGLGQNMGRSYPGYAGCFYGCAPFVPLVSTPMISFQTVSASPVGATNATGGLNAGATNSTLESLPDDVSTDHTQVVWYSGANTIPTKEIAETALAPIPHVMTQHMHMEHMDHMAMVHREGESGAVYIAGPVESVSATQAAAGARGIRKAARTYTNQDVDRINQQTGMVKYDGKSEKIQ
jgi:predicted metal-dependent RNase